MNQRVRIQRWVGWGVIGSLSLVFFVNGCALFEDEKTAKGRKLYHHYCMHCHGESGRQNQGFNWASMPDPRPKDLASEAEMSTFSDEEIFHTIYRDMKDTTPEVGDTIGDEEFAVPTMPTFKYTLSEEEIWSVVGFVRTLHGMSLTYDVDGKKQQLEANFQAAKQEFEAATKALDAAEEKIAEAEAAAEEAMAAAQEASGDTMEESDESIDEEEEEEVILPEEEALEIATAKFEAAEATFENFTKRPRQGQIPRPDLTISDEERAKLEKLGKRLYSNKYGCNGCHTVNQVGGLVGPELDRAGFRLNGTWIYRWILYPQGMKKHTRMPNLGISEKDGKALTMYLNTLRAPKPDQPILPLE